MLSIEDCFCYWEGLGDVLVVKYDGVRESNHYTVILLGKDSWFDPVRLEGDNLVSLLNNAVNIHMDKLKKN